MSDILCEEARTLLNDIIQWKDPYLIHSSCTASSWTITSFKNPLGLGLGNAGDEMVVYKKRIADADALDEIFPARYENWVEYAKAIHGRWNAGDLNLRETDFGLKVDISGVVQLSLKKTTADQGLLFSQLFEKLVNITISKNDCKIGGFPRKPSDAPPPSVPTATAPAVSQLKRKASAMSSAPIPTYKSLLNPRVKMKKAMGTEFESDEDD